MDRKTKRDTLENYLTYFSDSFVLSDVARKIREELLKEIESETSQAY